MGADIKKLRNRIKSVDSTLHLTSAMGLVASSKMRRALDGMTKGREYEAAVKTAIEPLLCSAECRKSPYMQNREEGKTLLLVFAGDRGLAGGYNANIFRLMREYPDADVIPIGKRACDRYKKPAVHVEGFSYRDAKILSEKICKAFCDKEYSKVGIVSTQYVSVMTQEARLRYVLPLKEPEEFKPISVVFEPDEMTILNSAVPEYLAGIIVSAARESFCSEIAARRTAMDSAGKNAQEMIDDLQIKYNRARQGAITQEITEIIAGSGA